MIEVESGDVLEMRDEAFGAVLDDINVNSGKSRLAVVLPVLTLIVGLAISYEVGGNALVSTR